MRCFAVCRYYHEKCLDMLCNMNGIDRQSNFSAQPKRSRSRRHFATTRWSVVLHAQKTDSVAAAEHALAILCETYWLPVYGFVRRSCNNWHEAEDLTQGFFAELLSRSFPRSLQPEGGRFRSWLLASVRNFLRNQFDRNAAIKRGGRVKVVSIDGEAIEDQILKSVSDNLPPERVFEREWATTLLKNVLARLREEMCGAGRGMEFEMLGRFLSMDRAEVDYRQASERLGISFDAARAAAHRIRKRYRRLLRAEIAETLADVEDIDDEIARLFVAVSEPG